MSNCAIVDKFYCSWPLQWNGYNTRVLVIYHSVLQHFGYKIFIAICDLLLYPFIHIDITGNIGIATHLYYIGNALIGYTHWYNVAIY